MNNLTLLILIMVAVIFLGCSCSCKGVEGFGKKAKRAARRARRAARKAASNRGNGVDCITREEAKKRIAVMNTQMDPGDDDCRANQMYTMFNCDYSARGGPPEQVKNDPNYYKSHVCGVDRSKCTMSC